jgi:hypothetical protein
VYAADQRRVESDTAMIAKLEEWRQLLAGPVQVDTFRDVTPARPGTAEHHTALHHAEPRTGGATSP